MVYCWFSTATQLCRNIAWSAVIHKDGAGNVSCWVLVVYAGAAGDVVHADLVASGTSLAG